MNARLSLDNLVESIKNDYIEFYEYDFIVLNRNWVSKRKKIIDIAISETQKWLSGKRFKGNLTLMLIDSIFSLRNNYEKMLKNILIPFNAKYPDKKLNDFMNISIKELQILKKRFNSKLDSPHSFSFSNRWKLFKSFVNFFVKEFEGDLIQIQKWAHQLNLRSYLKSEKITYNLKGFGIAGIQYLRMQLGVDTIKPETRIKNVMKFIKYNYHNDLELISFLSNTAGTYSLKPMELGFILWYGYPLLKKIMVKS